MNRHRQPQWVLDEHWAIDTDPYNFILFKRQVSRNGTPGRWAPKHFYPNLQQLFDSLARKMIRMEETGLPLSEHVNAVCDEVEARLSRFHHRVATYPWARVGPRQIQERVRNENAPRQRGAESCDIYCNLRLRCLL
jgi:hypothetical protein